MSDQDSKVTDEQEVLDEQAQPEEAAAAEENTEEVTELHPVAALEAKVEELEAQAAEAKDQALRAAAEAQNIRRRAEKDVESAHKFALEKFANALLPVVDNLERAKQQCEGSENDEVKALLEGVELTHKSFIDVLAKHDMQVVDPVGEPFDPQLHQAMTMVPNPAMEPNTVMDVMQKGFTLNGRLLRPAMVVVSKAAD